MSPEDPGEPVRTNPRIEPKLTNESRSLDPAQPATRRSGRKRKQRELQDGVGDWTEALKLCVCGYSAEPLDDADAPNVAQCRKEGCETKWVRLIFRYLLTFPLIR